MSGSKITYVLLIYLLVLVLGSGCSQEKFTKNFNDTFLFQDGLDTYTGVRFFNLLDGFPILKKGISSLQPAQFNTEMNASLQEIHPRDVNGSLRAVQRMLLDVRPTVQSSLKTVGSILERLRTGDPASYQTFGQYLEKLRWYPKAILRGVIPISADFVLEEYTNKGTDTLRNQVLEFTTDLKSKDSYDLITKLENMAFKALFLNTTIRSGSEELVNGFVGSSVVGDPSLRTGIVNIAYGLGDMMYERVGLSNNKSSDYIVKELIVNLEKYYTTGGSQYSGVYVNGNYPVDVVTVTSNLISQIRNIIKTDSSKTKNSTSPSNPSISISIGNELMVNLALFDFSSTVTGIEDSLLKLLQLDFKGTPRSSDSALFIPALESLFFTLSIVDSFGFVWSDNDDKKITGPNPNRGAMKVGDTLWALQSKLDLDNDLNFRSILNINSTSRQVFKDNVELSNVSTTRDIGINLNTEVLRLLEKESIGMAPPITSNKSGDTTYIRTIPWVLNWMKRIIYQGYGPYYNKNKKDSSGNYLTPDGSIYLTNSEDPNARYKSIWKTGDYKICITTSSGGKWVGLGGYEQSGTCGTVSTSAPVSVPLTSYTYTIKEIEKSASERAVESDEEAFYKNFQWLLYEKRFVVIIPAFAKLTSVTNNASTTASNIQEALYIVAIGNGLKGMMGLRPNCGPSGSLQGCIDYNGIWNSSTSLKLKQYDLPGKLESFSDLPGDSVLLVEGWGYGSTMSGNFQKAFILPSPAFSYLVGYYSSPSSIYGMIPPVISQNFDVLERLGFLNNIVVRPTNVMTYWNDRNKLTPLIVALAKAIDDQVDTSVTPNKNPYDVLISLSTLLSRPFIFNETGDTNCSGTCNYQSVRLRGDILRGSLGSTSTVYSPSSSIRSPLSFFVENNRKAQDGVLYLVSKTKLLTGLVNLLAELGKSSKAEGRGKILSGLIKVMGQVKMVSTDSLPSNGFDFYDYLTNSTDGLLTKLATYPDTRSADLNSSDWKGVSDSVFFIRDYLSSRSGYSLVRSLEFLLLLLADVPPSSQEITAFIELFGQILKNNSGGQAYRIRTILQDDVPVLLETIAPNARNIYAIAGGMGKPGKFFSYMENSMRIVPYTILELLADFEKFTTSELIQRTDNNENSLLYSSGILIKAFADIHQFGKKLDPTGFPFADNMNVDENGTETNVWNRLNMILSSKK